MAELSFCLVSTFYPPASFGGDGIHVQRLARGLAARGHRVRVVHNPDAYGSLRGVIADDGTIDADDGVEVVSAGVGRGGTVATYLAGRPVGYRRTLRQLMEGFDVVHFHNPSLLGGPGALGLTDALRVYTTHEHWLVCPTHVLFRFEREVCERRTCFRCTLSYGRPPQPWRATPTLRHAVRNVHLMLCPSRFTAGIHRQHFPDARIAVLPLACTRPMTPPPPKRARPYFLYAGRLEAIKGVDRLVAAFPRVRGADLLVAGDGTQREDLHRQAAACDSVVFLGRVPESEVFSLARGALAVVVPSSGYETFGGVAIEAMAGGTPAVVRDLGALPELVEEGGGVTFADDDELVEVLQSLVDDPSRAAALGARAEAVAAARFGEERFFRDYLALLADAAAAEGFDALAERLRLTAAQT